MHLNPYGEYAVLLAQSLADAWPEDRTGVVARMRLFGMTRPFPEAPGDHSGCRAVLDGWLAVVDETDPGRRAALLNAEMEAASASPRLTDHDGEGWHLHYRDGDGSLPRVLQGVLAVGTALHLTTRGMDRLARCAADPCTAVVVDLTRQGTRRYCSPRCGSRDAVRRHRERRRAAT